MDEFKIAALVSFFGLAMGFLGYRLLPLILYLLVAAKLIS